MELPSYNSWHKIKISQCRSDVDSEGNSEGLIFTVCLNEKKIKLGTERRRF